MKTEILNMTLREVIALVNKQGIKEISESAFVSTLNKLLETKHWSLHSNKLTLFKIGEDVVEIRAKYKLIERESNLTWYHNYKTKYYIGIDIAKGTDTKYLDMKMADIQQLENDYNNKAETEYNERVELSKQMLKDNLEGMTAGDFHKAFVLLKHLTSVKNADKRWGVQDMENCLLELIEECKAR